MTNPASLQGSSISWIAKVKLPTGKSLEAAIRAERDPARFDKTMTTVNGLYFPNPNRPIDHSQIYTDITQLLHLLLLSERSVLQSHQLFELPTMLRAFGLGGTIELLKLRAVPIVTDWFTFSHMRRAKLFSYVQAICRKADDPAARE